VDQPENKKGGVGNNGPPLLPIVPNRGLDLTGPSVPERTTHPEVEIGCVTGSARSRVAWQGHALCLLSFGDS